MSNTNTGTVRFPESAPSGLKERGEKLIWMITGTWSIVRTDILPCLIKYEQPAASVFLDKHCMLSGLNNRHQNDSLKVWGPLQFFKFQNNKPAIKIYWREIFCKAIPINPSFTPLPQLVTDIFNTLIFMVRTASRKSSNRACTSNFAWFVIFFTNQLQHDRLLKIVNISFFRYF